jgi:hypothetical protein
MYMFRVRTRNGLFWERAICTGLELSMGLKFPEQPVLTTSPRTLIPRTALFSVLDLCIKNWSSVLFYEQVALWL